MEAIKERAPALELDDEVVEPRIEPEAEPAVTPSGPEASGMPQASGMPEVLLERPPSRRTEDVDVIYPEWSFG